MVADVDLDIAAAIPRAIATDLDVVRDEIKRGERSLVAAELNCVDASAARLRELPTRAEHLEAVAET